MSSHTRSAAKSAASSPRGKPAKRAKEDIRHYSLADLEAMHKRGETVPTPPDAPVIELGEEFWKNLELIMPGEKPKSSIHLRVDYDVLDWFKSKGKGHLTRMNAVLRAYYETNRKKAS